jgi:hypothetical protein
MNTLHKLILNKIKLFLFFSFFGLIATAQKRSTKSEYISYYRYIPEKMTWNEHKKRAAEMGGHLACITNSTDNEQVRRIAGGEIIWVGGIRKDCGNGPGSDYWKWYNGKEWSYTNWRVGEPNNYTKHDENRVMLWENGEWNDASLFHEFPAVYEIPFKFYFERKKTSTSKQSVRPLMSIVPPSGTWHGQWQTMFGAIVIDRGNDDLMLTFHDNGTITGCATDPRNGSFKVTGTWSSDGKVKFTYSNPGNGNDGEIAHGQVKGNRMETDWTNRHCSGNAQYEYDQSSLKDINSSDVKNLNVSGAGSVEVNGSYVFVPREHPNRIFGTIAGHYQHTTNPAIFIGFQNCGRLFNKPEWNKWVIFTEKGASYAAHTNRQINVPPRFGEWETVDHWPSGVEEAGKHPAPSIHYDKEKYNRVSNYISANDILDDSQSKQNEINNQPLSYYKFIPENMTWNEHNNRAIAMGGNLASISNAIENNKVKEVSNGVNVWLGGLRKGCGNDSGADHWFWSNGKKWSYTNWMKNQPDNYHITHNMSEKSENRVHMTQISHGQQWNDISEDYQFSAVYELPIIDDSVDYFENNNIRLKNSNKIIRNPLRIILGSILTSRSGFQLKNIKSIGTE